MSLPTIEVSEPHPLNETHGLSPEAQKMKVFIDKFKKIDEKNRCVRVRFLDWLSTKLMSWSKSVKNMSDRIDSPCVIKINKK